MEIINQQENTTRKILEKYHELGHQQTLKDWRENIPREVRKTWLRSLIQEKAGDNITQEHELFDQMIENSLSKENKNEYQTLKERISSYKEKLRSLKEINSKDTDDEIESMDDALTEAYFDMEYFLQDCLDDHMLSHYAQAYFLTFENDPAGLEKHFEKQDHIISKVINYLDWLTKNDGQELRKLYNQLPITSLSEGNSLRDIALGKLKPIQDLCSTIIVCGSGAIGPRSDLSKIYPRKQDTDILFIPKTQTDKFKADYQLLQIIIDYANLLQNKFTADKDAQDESYVQLPDLPPLVKEIMDFFSQPTNNVDLHTPTLHADGLIEDWRKLCGPHRVAKKLSSGWEKDYRFFLQKSIEASTK